MNKTDLNDALISTWKKAYEEVLRYEKGVRSDLEISEEMFDDFCRIGYIQQGMSGDWQETWKLTNFGRKQMKSYIALFNQGERLDSIEADLNAAIAELKAIIA